MKILWDTMSGMTDTLLMKKGESLVLAGHIETQYTSSQHHLIAVDDLESFHHISEDTYLFIPYITSPNLATISAIYEASLIAIEGGYTTTPKSDEASFVKAAIEHIGVTIVDKKHYDHYCQLLKLADYFSQFYIKYPQYQYIIYDKDLYRLDELLFLSEEKDQWINRFLVTGSHYYQFRELAQQFLNALPRPTTYHPVTQEEQISLFLDWSKKKDQAIQELVDDAFIHRIEATSAYQWIKDRLLKSGFKLSKTQQFNSLQHTGLLIGHSTPILYNLSDMGAGKTLMTVESILLAQKIIAEQNIKRFKDYKLDDFKRVTLQLPNVHIIAPTLSLKSSWLTTFEKFIPLEKITENHYTYTFLEGHVTCVSHIYLSGFTVKRGNLHVDQKLPQPDCYQHQYVTDFLVIDEIHQLVDRAIKFSKFVDTTDRTLDVYNHYRTFVLSGTLSNLLTHEWYHLIQFLSIPDRIWNIKNPNENLTAMDAKKEADILQTSYQKELSDMASHLKTQQRRTFDPVCLPTDTVRIEAPKQTYKEHYFNLMYNTILMDWHPIQPDDPSTIDDQLIKRHFNLVTNPKIFASPNFELFYRLVSQSVVTAKSLQVAKELFGEQKQQHKAQVIRTTSHLTQKDLEILKRVHQLVEHNDQYKSPRLATKIAHAILNLNDGLQAQSLYDILNQAALSNTRFLDYLTRLDVSLLKTIQQSAFIHTPKLEETEKFQVLQHLLQKEKQETFLIVVNDSEAALKLSKALGLKALTKQEMTQERNYQDVLDARYKEQNMVVVPQHMIKSSLDLVQVNRLVQYQLNTNISDIIQTQNRINRVGQTRETKAYYIATDVLQENLINLFLEAYRNIKVAHEGIIELFVDIDKQVDVISDYLGQAFKRIESNAEKEDENIKEMTTLNV